MNRPECLWLIRHAETAVPNVFHGAESDVDLSSLGEQQAMQLAHWLRTQRPSVVVSSGMLRARRTAMEIAAVCGIEHHIEEQFHERRVGVLGGQPFDSIQGLWADTITRWTQGEIDYTTPDAESYRQVRERALAAWQQTCHRFPGERVAIVAHGITCKILLLSLLPEYGPSGWQRLGRVPNTAVTQLVPDHMGNLDVPLLLAVPEEVARLSNFVPTGLGINAIPNTGAS